MFCKVLLKGDTSVPRSWSCEPAPIMSPYSTIQRSETASSNMNYPPLPFGVDKTLLRLDGQGPYFCLHFVKVFVRDQEKSLQFYLHQLGFRLVVDQRIESGGRWIEVSPPDGNATIALILGSQEGDAEPFRGLDTGIYFITEDVTAKFRELSARGVRFHFPPRQAHWGGIHARFEDLDGNSYGLAGFDELTRGVETGRRVLIQARELERRAAQELEIAKQVQSKLFPQIHPELRTLEYAGVCVQARVVGGDYFDFLDLGQGRVAFVIADVSGKGIASALLMANLQANLRSQYMSTVDHPQGLLRSVNRRFFENTNDNVFASLLLATYDDNQRRLYYANCGHLSGLLLRRDHAIERLDPTATVLGIFEDWDCSVEACDVGAGDTLVLYTDGVTEASNDLGEEFGEQRLIEVVRRTSELSPAASLNAVLREVEQFSQREQQDDITLIIARGRPG
jgi:serine phosphatase RsbU (regulator of sigma subunit)/catechol 2,3-dioxygenase-like lactoylglutathione lyase family enzyme